MEEFKIFVIYFIRLDGKVRSSDAFGRKVSGEMRAFRKKESEKEEEKKKKGWGRGRGEGAEREPYLSLSAFVPMFFFFFFLKAHIFWPISCIYSSVSPVITHTLMTIISIVLIRELL